jgi:protein-L-isoaspartate(D-aspartate) O-methyltransferase
MSLAMTNHTARRTTMVDTQIRPSDVTKYPIIDAMLKVAREDFVPGALRDTAYADENLSLGEGRVVLEPRTLAKMLEALDIQGDELVLDIGSAYGYSAAVMARMAEAVVAVEEIPAIAEESQSILSEHGADNVIPHQGVLTEGAPKHGPYDVITLQGGAQHLPESLTDQLKEGGRIACLFMQGALGQMRVGYKIDGVINWRFAFNAGAPILPGFEKHNAFTL